jgi:hypothetical protein
MWKSLMVSFSLALLAAVPAHAGTQLQVQFQRWIYEGDGLATLLVTLRNPTMKPFAKVVWDAKEAYTPSALRVEPILTDRIY